MPAGLPLTVNCQSNQLFWGMSGPVALASSNSTASSTGREELHRLRGHDQSPKVILGVKVNDGSRSSDRKLKPLPPTPLVIKFRR